MLYLLYSTLGYALYACLVLLLPVAGFFSGRYGYGLEQRLGRYQPDIRPEAGSTPLLWVHASSVGEVQAALIVIHGLLTTRQDVQVVLSTTTAQGQKMAAARLGSRVICVLAPLDFPPAVRRALRFFRPTLYIGLETELWPVMLTTLDQAGVSKLLLNGRLSERSLKRYLHIYQSISPLVRGFRALAVITPEDGARFKKLGADASKLQVCGNLKYDMPAENREDKARLFRSRLGVVQEQVFICGSTHEGEEALLLPGVQSLMQEMELIWVIAPRHLERLSALAHWCRQENLAYDLYSSLADSPRKHAIVLLDTMGELSELYAAADFIFCGGSLVDRGGHNVMEPARWGKPVYFGPHMKDFQDAAQLLRDNSGGFQVADALGLEALLRHHHQHPAEYATACCRAAETAKSQRGSVARQVALVMQSLQEQASEERSSVEPAMSA